MTQPAEVTSIHTRLLKCALEVEDSRAYWSHRDGSDRPAADVAFSEYWFGARSMSRVEVLLTNFRARFDAYPQALRVLHAWRHMSPPTRSAVCHWHLQLADPLYRAFSGEFLVKRRDGPRPEVTRDLVTEWVADQGPGRWTMATKIQFASKLLSSAYAAELVRSKRDPRPLGVPQVPDEALEYLLHLLREVTFEGSLMDNPYLASVGLDGSVLTDRLATLPSLRFGSQAGVVHFGWRYDSLEAWAQATVAQEEELRS